MNILSVVGKIRTIIGKLTDLLIKGRQAGLWDERNTPRPFVGETLVTSTQVPLGFLGSIWDWLNGKKLYLGAVITLLTALSTFLGLVLPVFGVSAVLVAQYVGYATMLIGLLHKLAKALGTE